MYFTMQRDGRAEADHIRRDAALNHASPRGATAPAPTSRPCRKQRWPR